MKRKLIIAVIVLCLVVVGVGLLKPSPAPVVNEETNMEYRIMENVDSQLKDLPRPK